MCPIPKASINRPWRTSRHRQAKIVADLKKDGIEASPDVDIIALIAYLQRVGTDIKQQPATEVVQAQ